MMTAPLLGAHERQDGLGHQEARFQVHIDDFLPVALDDLLGALHACDACIINQDVNRSEAVARLANETFDFGGTGYVGAECTAIPAKEANLLRCAFCVLGTRVEV